MTFGGQTSCEGVNRAACRWRPMISPSLKRSLESNVAVVSSPARTGATGDGGRGARANAGLATAVFPLDAVAVMSTLRAGGTGETVGRGASHWSPERDFPPCNGHNWFNWRVWNRSHKGCTLPIGRVKNWLARPLSRGSCQRLARAPCAVFCTMSPCSPTHALLENLAPRWAVQAPGRASAVVLRERPALGPQRLLGRLCR